MKIKMEEAIQVLDRTPLSLEIFLGSQSDGRSTASEGEGGWNVAEVIGHLIEAEKTEWIPRIQNLLKDWPEQSLPSHLGRKTATLEERLLAFKLLRDQNMNLLKAMLDPARNPDNKDLHSEFDSFQLSELLSAWVVHDLTHLSQIVRLMANQYEMEAGPWKQYLGTLTDSE